VNADGTRVCPTISRYGSPERRAAHLFRKRLSSTTLRDPTPV
jgi:hypothetical protein